MVTHHFQDLPMPVSLLGMGCMRLPVTGEGKDRRIDSEKAAEIIDYAYNNGINYFDSAHPYHDGQSEAFTAGVLSKYPRDSYYFATKMPLFTLAEIKDLSIDDAKRIFNEQLERTKLDYFDFYLMHNIYDDSFEMVKKLKLYEYFLQLKSEGLVKHIGFSFHDTPEVLKQVVDTYTFDFAQIQLNYIDWTMQRAKEQYEILRSHNLPVVVMEPVRGGRLAALDEKAASLIKGAAPEKSIASWAVRFVASLPGIMTVLSGMTTMEQIVDNISTVANFIPLSDSERNVLDKAIEIFNKNGIVPCTGCEYCMPCPTGVNIPRNFAVFNDYAISNKANNLKKRFAQIDESNSASACIACGQCIVKCPQSIEIPDRLREIAELIK